MTMITIATRHNTTAIIIPVFLSVLLSVDAGHMVQWMTPAWEGEVKCRCEVGVVVRMYKMGVVVHMYKMGVVGYVCMYKWV